VAYGPDDPAYGPPSPDWYQRADEARLQEVQDERRQSRGAFEPLPPDHEVTAPPPPAPADANANAGGLTDDEPVGTGQADGNQADGSQADELDDDLDVALVGQGAGPLEGIKDLYVTAEAIGERRLDKHFEQLLERQRQLISDYFTKQEFRGSAGPRRAAATRPAPAAAEGTAGPENERFSFGGVRRSPR
jgi:hypothetical protein